MRHRQPAGIFELKIEIEKNMFYLWLSLFGGGLRWRSRSLSLKKKTQANK
ncbi:hypothetical protein [Neolewinella agarilytica]|uniref:Uncharacterized protein n=1 Tax=Neolewinella agarilytica TaxID=478744 RepID=A0A1H9PDQ9_9BACT|nr:hypothetical protein [Neolewinella agarilytica]SER46292.1 hypothetical protein SAMN05444359_1473 [Neolewinella agarilytica]